MTTLHKNTNATSSAFGWDFQYNLALYLVMDQELTQLEKFKVEGQTEDIEIYFRNKEPIYIQAKAQENPYSRNTTTQHLSNAINSLINAVYNVNEKFSEVIYGTNIEVPIRANRYPYLFQGLRVNLKYDELPDTHKKKLDLIFDKTTVPIDFEKLKQNMRILKITFHGSDDETRYRLIREKVINRLNEIGLQRYKAVKVFSYLQNEFKNNASQRIYLSIEKLGELIILYSINAEDNTVYEVFDIPQFNETSLKTDFSELILNKSLDFEFVTSVITEFNKFSLTSSTRRDTVKNFINENYGKYREDILNLHDDICGSLLDDLTKVILFQILSSHSDINSVRTGLNI